MKSQLTYFLASLALGLGSFLVYALMRLLAKKTNLIPVTIILDFLWCVLTAAAYLAVNVWLKDGQPHIYAACATIGGIFLGALLSTLLKETIEKSRQKRLQKDGDKVQRENKSLTNAKSAEP